jgi:outer membrane protein assembly factor BamB
VCSCCFQRDRVLHRLRQQCLRGQRKRWQAGLESTNSISLLQVSPAVAYGKVFVPALDGTYAFDTGTGALIWKNPAVQGGDQSPAVANGVLYIAGFEITALNANSGQDLWRNRSEYFDTSPVVANGVVYVGGTNMSALDAQTGSLLWQSPIAGGDSFSSPAIANGILYFSTGAGGLHAFGLPGGN